MTYTTHNVAEDIKKASDRAICPAFKQDLIELSEYFAKQMDCALTELPKDTLVQYSNKLAQVTDKRYDFKYSCEDDYYDDMHIVDVELEGIEMEFEFSWEDQLWNRRD